MRVIKKCKKCGQGFRGSRSTQLYCSRKCNNARYKKNKKAIKCLICKSSFVPKNKTSIYCSRSCSDRAASSRIKKRNYKHGMRYTRFYHVWRGMILRCSTPTSSSYKRYGAKGIKVCKRWQIFINFRDDMYNKYLEHAKEFGEKNTTIDRIDNNKGYLPGNCRWATWKLQKENSNQFRLRDKTGKYKSFIKK